MNITRDFLIIITCGSQCLFYIILCCLTFQFYTLKHPVLHLARTCLFYGILCCPGRVRSTTACIVPGSIHFKEASGTYLFYNNLCCPWMCMFSSSLCCPWALYSSLCWPQKFLFDSSLCCPGRCLTYKQLVLHLDVSVYESLCCAEPGRVCLTVHNSITPVSCAKKQLTVSTMVGACRGLSPILLRFLSNPVAEFIDLWQEDEVSSGIGLSYRPPNHVIWPAMPVRQPYAGVDFIT